MYGRYQNGRSIFTGKDGYEIEHYVNETVGVSVFDLLCLIDYQTTAIHGRDCSSSNNNLKLMYQAKKKNDRARDRRALMSAEADIAAVNRRQDNEKLEDMPRNSAALNNRWQKKKRYNKVQEEVKKEVKREVKKE